MMFTKHVPPESEDDMEALVGLVISRFDHGRFLPNKAEDAKV